MARIDKTQSAVGVVRAPLNFAIVEADYDTLIGVGLNAQGRIVRGAGNTGILGVINPSKARTKIGQITDIFVLGDAVDCTGLAAGTVYYADGVTGALAAGAAGTGAAPGAGAGSTPGSARIGFTVEADRLVIRK
ncbi:minor capsid protein [Arthrobacter phage Wollypog]|uniref:Minor capsid protein n=1 Tax=Arthrobacter phage Wollypog TaxID=2790985 RepID=A0A7T3KC72_9CAUD|nr:minor capsid protein [Arthrobacter phage Wollypog]QPX62558.1 minor capsid protein [Arthrobacter phage Wollypog]